MAKPASKSTARTAKPQSVAFKYLDQVVARQTAVFYNAFPAESVEKKAAPGKKTTKRAVGV